MTGDPRRTAGWRRACRRRLISSGRRRPRAGPVTSSPAPTDGRPCRRPSRRQQELRHDQPGLPGSNRRGTVRVGRCAGSLLNAHASS
jgi:hypothetical protein